jgi:UDP-N-acetylmuramate--alanine ligase
MVVWLMFKLNLPVSYSIGSTINFGPSGKFEPGSQFFIYEADEYDRNFLNFKPYLSLITNVDYDHPDIYRDRNDYVQAFEQFKQQSSNVIESEHISQFAGLKLSGHNKDNASLAINAVLKMVPNQDLEKLIEVASQFPGTGRRMESLADRIYSDYAPHPN